MHTEVPAVCSDIHANHIHTLCVQNEEFLNVLTCWYIKKPVGPTGLILKLHVLCTHCTDVLIILSKQRLFSYIWLICLCNFYSPSGASGHVLIWYDMIYMIWDVMWCVMWYVKWYVMWCDIWCDIYDIFVNCNWVVTRWEYYNTHLHTDNT